MPLEGRRKTDYDDHGNNVMSKRDLARMKASIPLWKRPLICILQPRNIMLVAAVVAIVVGVKSIRQSNGISDRNDDRDLARLYQRCGQQVAATNASNVTVRVLRDAVLRTRKLRLEQAARTTDQVLRRAFLRSAAGYLTASRQLIQAPVVNCDRAYPNGPRLSKRYPNAAPTETPSTR